MPFGGEEAGLSPGNNKKCNYKLVVKSVSDDVPNADEESTAVQTVEEGKFDRLVIKCAVTVYVTMILAGRYVNSLKCFWLEKYIKTLVSIILKKDEGMLYVTCSLYTSADVQLSSIYCNRFYYIDSPFLTSQGDVEFCARTMWFY